jgi:hypothetical protein
MNASIFSLSSDPSSLCVSCHDPLILSIEPDSDIEAEGVNEENEGKILKPSGQPSPSSSSSVAAGFDAIPDDVELRCGCHFHW